MGTLKISGNIADPIKRRIFTGTIEVSAGKIINITEDNEKYNNYILPGYIDAHIHVESSMLIPSEFARLAVVHGTVATVSDPHEIANVLGVDGVRYMIKNGKKVPFKFYFGAPSCVPATSFETAGTELNSDDIKKLFEEDNLHYLSEMMNFPGVLFRDTEVMKKLEVAKQFGKPIDGHAPGLKGEDAKNYIEAGISTDHECYMIEEAYEKIKYGMKILIREGSAAKNYETLRPLISEHTGSVMLCSDDKHPDNLAESHINEIVKRSLKYGYDLFDVIQCASVNAVKHYNLDVGLLQINDFADFIVTDNLTDLNILQTYINGELVSENGKTFIKSVKEDEINNFKAVKKSLKDFEVPARGNHIRVIEAMDGELITNELIIKPTVENGRVVPDSDNDILKLSVINRYKDVKPAVCFIKNIGLIKGAIASCVGHDSHNIIAVGTNDKDLCEAVNAVILHKGGISISADGKTKVLPLPVAGIMSNEDGYIVAEKYSEMDKIAKSLGTNLHAPFMTLSFMALLVIPSLKLSDKGLFDGRTFKFTELFAD
ncbi:MAG: adenine deaminase [Ignavibacteriae bacterium]|nr:adenine deaminase [Ignavibacteriota bacterium]